MTAFDMDFVKMVVVIMTAPKKIITVFLLGCTSCIMEMQSIATDVGQFGGRLVVQGTVY